jgi:hypothetical protein
MMSKTSGKAGGTQSTWTRPGQATRSGDRRETSSENSVYVITGLTTDDQLQQQLRIDEVIRDKVTNTLARQISFEQTMATIYSNLTKEEETLHSMINSLQFQHDQDKARHTRMTAYQSVVLEDIDRRD